MSVKNLYKIINRAAFFSYRPIILDNRFVVQQGGKFLSTVTEAFEITSVTNDNGFKPKIKLRFGSKEFRGFFLENPNYANLIFKPETSITETSCRSLKILKQFSNDFNDEEEVLTMLPGIMSEELADLTHDELLEVIGLVLKCCTKSLKNDMWLKIVKDLNQELIIRFKSSKNYDDALKSLYLIKEFGYIKYFWFFYVAIDKLLKKVSRFTKEQFVFFMYLVIPVNEALLKNKKFNLNSNAFCALPHLSSQEIGILYHGFEKLKIKFSNPEIIPATLDKFINDVEHLDSNSLKTVCHVISTQSKHLHNTHDIADFQEKMIPHVSKFSPISLVFLLMTNINYDQLNMTLAEKVFEAVKKDISLCRETALEKLLYLMVQFNIKDDEFVKLVIEKFESIVKIKNIDISSYTALMKVLQNLMHLQIYPDVLLRFTMTTDFLRSLMSSKFTTAIVFWYFVNSCLNLDRPQYYCDQLTVKEQKKISNIKIFMSFNPRERIAFYTTNFHLEECLNEIYGEGMVLWNAPILHYPPVVLLRFDRNFQAQPIPEEFIKKDFGTRKPLDDDHFWLCFLTTTRTCFTNNDNELNFVIQTKIRHFEKVGFKPVLVSITDLKTHKKNKTVDTFLKDLINKSIMEIMEQKKLQLST